MDLQSTNWAPISLLSPASGSRPAALPAPWRSFACLAVTLLVGCENNPQIVCTLIGCSSGVEVTLTRMPAAAFSVELAPLGAPAAYIYRCPNPSNCPTAIYFPEFTPDYVTVRVIVGADTATAEAAQPLYTEFRPNGARCPPTCRVGHLAVAPPGLKRAGRPN